MLTNISYTNRCFCFVLLVIVSIMCLAFIQCMTELFSIDIGGSGGQAYISKLVP